MERTGYLCTSEAALASHAVRPASGPTRGFVLLFPPLFEERKSCAVVLAQLARALADGGFASLRFDPRGTGDSSGELTDAGVEVWLADALHVRNRFRDVGDPVILLGIRSGALLAVATQAAFPADALVLWEPVSSGSEVMRQAVQRKLVNDMAAFGFSAETRNSLDEAWARGETVDLDGYRVSSNLHAGLLALAPPPVPAAVPVLLVAARAGRGTDEAMSRLCPGAERRMLPTPPFWSTVGLVDVASPVRNIVEHLCQRFSKPSASFFPDVWLPALDTTWRHETHVAVPTPQGQTLRAVWHCPDSAPKLQVLCLSGWSGCRLGPHNVFVSLARRLVAQGVATLRLDFGGRGESPGDPSLSTIAGMAEDARAAVAWLRDRGSPSKTPLAIVAICSGCKVAITVASEDPGISRMVLWSPEPMGSLRPSGTNRRKSLAILRTYLLKLLRRETWRKMLRGGVQGRMVGKALLRQETRGGDEARSEEDILARFRRYGGGLYAVFGGGDPEAAGSEAAYAAFCARHGISLERHRIAKAGHSFYRSDWAAELLEKTSRWLGPH